MSASPRLDLVVPCYNPTEGWHLLLCERFEEVQQTLDVDVRLILINDGSTRGVDAAHIQYLESRIDNMLIINEEDNRGKGHAVRLGMKHASADTYAFTDVDFPYETECLAQMYHAIQECSGDIIIGHRTADYYRQIPVSRRLLSRTLKYMMKTLMRLPVQDTQSGLKFFNETGRDQLLLTTVDRYLFDLELIKSAHKSGLSICSIPVELRPGIVMPSISIRLLLHELGTFLSLMLR